jgi:hypothetical protein
VPFSIAGPARSGAMASSLSDLEKAKADTNDL